MLEITLSVLVLVIVTLVAINTIYSLCITKIVNMPSSPATRHAISRDLRDRFRDCDGKHIYDLGSGYGGMCRGLAKAFPKADVSGFELSPIPYAIAKIRRTISFRKNYQIKHADIFKTDLSQADILVIYLSPHHMTLLRPKLDKELKRGAVVYSQGFPLPDWKADSMITVKLSLEQKLYVYRV